MSKRNLTPYLFVCFLAVILPLNIICIFLMNTLIHTWKQRSNAEMSSILASYMERIDNTLSKASGNLNILSDNYYFIYLQRAGQGSESEDQYALLRAQYYIFDLFKNWLSADELCSGYFLCCEKDGILIHRNQNSSQADKTRKYLKENLFEALEVNEWSTFTTEEDACIYYLKKDSDSYYGVWFDLDEISVNLGLGEQEGVYYRLGTEGTQNVSGRPCLKSNYANVYLEVSSETYNSLNRVDHFIRILVFFSFITLLTFPFICVILNRQIVKPLRQLQDAIYRMKNGELNYRIPLRKSSYSEFDQLNQSFNSVLEMLNDLKHESYELRITQNETKIKYLTQQIQPHFILNALNILYCYEPDQYQQMQEMILCLTRYFRYIVSASAPFIPLHQELQHLENYLKIQNIRYSNCIDVMIDCEPWLANMKIPPLAIQTLVENSIKYGILPQKVTQIIVEAHCNEDKYAVIKIADSGPGFNPRILEQINTFLKTRSPQEDLGIGICNTIERFDLLYDKKARIYFSNREPSGILIEIIVPVVLVEAEEGEL